MVRTLLKTLAVQFLLMVVTPLQSVVVKIAVDSAGSTNTYDEIILPGPAMELVRSSTVVAVNTPAMLLLDYTFAKNEIIDTVQRLNLGQWRGCWNSYGSLNTIDPNC